MCYVYRGQCVEVEYKKTTQIINAIYAGDSWLIFERLFLAFVPVYDLCSCLCVLYLCVCVLMLACVSQPKAGPF